MKSNFTAICLLVSLALLLCGLPHVFSQQVSADAAEESTQQQAWEACKAALEAKGEHMDLAWFNPPPVPDDKNFALTPLLKPLLDYTVDPKTHTYVFSDPDPPVKKISVYIEGATADNPSSKSWETGHARNLEALQVYYRASLPGMTLSKSAPEDVLAVLSRFDAMFAELRREMQARPLCRYPVHYELGMSRPLPHLTVIRDMVRVLSSRASAMLALNHPDEAFADLEFGFRLSDTIRDEPGLIPGLVDAVMATTLLQAVWEGIAAHRWNDAQLATLEKELQRLDFLSDFDRGMRYERVSGIGQLQNGSKDPNGLAGLDLKRFGLKNVTSPPLGGPAYRAAIYRNQIVYSTMIQAQFLGIMDEKGQTVNVTRAREAQKAFDEMQVSPSNFLAKALMQSYASVAKKFSRMQTYTNLGAAGCEIERYRLAHDKLPATLDALHMPALPHDVINGEPLHYRLEGDGNYLLYSVGWNEKDDGGKIVVNAKGFIDDQASEQGDWVWSLKPL